MREDLIPTGEIVNTHGLRGHVKVMPWADSPDDLLDLDRFFIDGQAYQVEHASRQKSMVLLKLQGVDTQEQAQALRGKELCLSREDVELEDGVVFITDLIGLPVEAEGQVIGKIEEVLTLPGNDVYVVRGAERSYMIPAVREYVEPLDVSQGVVRVRLIEGMECDAD